MRLMNIRSESNNRQNFSPESIISRESTPSEFPLVKNAVKFLLKKDKRLKIKPNSRSIFSPLSIASRPTSIMDGKPLHFF